MKLIIAIIKPYKLDEVKAALTDLGVTGMTVTEVKGHGRQKGHKEMYRGAEYFVDFVAKMQLMIAVPDGLADEAMAAIRTAATTGEIGDGKLFVLELAEAMRIRTGETGDEAL
ncbi:MAG: P-II family nitrogen regulator [Nitrospirota bacterium]|nr:P-II family nitrogen regulator [Nitrospirota bacterium]